MIEMFPFYDEKKQISNTDSIITRAPECNICLKQKKLSGCQTSQEGFSQCSKGYTRYKSPNSNYITFFGLKIQGHYNPLICKKNYKDRDVHILKKEKFLSTLAEIEKLNREKVLFKRFLHDLGQYTGGLVNLLPSRRDLESGRDHITNKELKSIVAFANAIVFFRKFNSNSLLKGESFGEKYIVFSPFQLFDKFRLCFHTDDININLSSKGKSRSEYKVECLEGFELIVLNLISNAVKYLPKKRCRDINITFDKTDKEINIKISSYGPPVMEEEVPKLGKLHFRSTSANSYGISGDGIGLNMITEYTEKAGLTVNYSSNSKQTISDGKHEYWLFQSLISIPVSFIKKTSKTIN